MIRRSWNTRSWKSDSLALLKERGCPVCARRFTEVRRDLFWFVNEQYYEPEVVAELRRSYGFCPTHTRHLLATGASSVITTVFSYLTEYGINRLQDARAVLDRRQGWKSPGDRCRRAGGVLRPQGLCRECRALRWWEDHNISIVLESLPDAGVREAYERSAGLCLPHFRKAGLKANWDSLCFLAHDMRRRLMALRFPETPPALLLNQVWGMDQEGSLRRTGKKVEPSDASSAGTEDQCFGTNSKSWSPTFEDALTLLAGLGCPVCRMCKRAGEIYARWLAQEMETVGSPSAHWDPSWRVCPFHFWELWASGHEHAAVLIAEHTALDWLWKLGDLLAGLADRPSDHLMDRLAAVPAAWRHRPSDPRGRAPGLWSTLMRTLAFPACKLDRLRATPFQEGQCQACSYIQETIRRTLGLILRVVEDPAGRQAYHQAGGLCLRHCVMAAGVAENPAALSELFKAQIIRLRLLEWELEEASRRLNWSVRYESKGPEGSAWQRAGHQFCGSIVGDS